MTAAVSVRIEHRSISRAKIQRRHDNREGIIPKYVDRARINQNSVLIKQPFESEIAREVLRRRELQPRERAAKHDAAITTNGVITFSHDAQRIIESLPKQTQDELFSQAAERIAAYCNSDLVGLVVHRDESAIHAHFTMYAVDRDGIALAKKLKKADTSKLQDIAAEPFISYGINRGEKKADKIKRLIGEGKSSQEINRAVIHRSVKQLHEDLPDEISLLQQQIDLFKQKLDKNQRLLEELQRKLELGKVAADKAQKLAETYARRAESARKELEGVEQKLKHIQSKMPPIPQSKKPLFGEPVILAAEVKNWAEAVKTFAASEVLCAENKLREAYKQRELVDAALKVGKLIGSELGIDADPAELMLAAANLGSFERLQQLYGTDKTQVSSQQNSVFVEAEEQKRSNSGMKM